ncbi:hypothetical protein ABW19_dt0206397 [Dactylella cylindrospora]|nr:hypothetical protein ABW19_dt0206397 [Dactylella cylindrospora]
MPPERNPESKSRQISQKEWERQKDNFIELYIRKNLPIENCIALMEIRHGFVASKRQYLRKIREWNIDKNIKAKEMRVAVRKVIERTINSGKDTNIEVRGVPISRDQMKRFIRRDVSKNTSEDDDITSRDLAGDAEGFVVNEDLEGNAFRCIVPCCGELKGKKLRTRSRFYSGMNPAFWMGGWSGPLTSSDRVG